MRVGQGQIAVHAHHQFAGRFRNDFAPFAAKGLDFRDHICWIEEARIVQIDILQEWFDCISHLRHFAVGVSVIQVARNFLHEPHAGDVLQETIGTVSAPLIREVRFVGGTVIYRCVVFDTDQRPSAAAEVGPFTAQRRHADDGGCRIVRRCSDHFDFGQIIAFRQISLHIADFRSWHNQFRELLSRDADKFKQVLVELAGFEIQHLRR